MLSDFAAELRDTVARDFQLLSQISEEDAGITSRPGQPAKPGQWSKKQEIGHLIDSATNNHIRFVKASLEHGYQGPTYDQEGSVTLHGYGNMPWLRLIGFWRDYNLLLADLIANMADDLASVECRIGSAEPVTLTFLVKDYILHLQHHLDHVVDREHITAYPGAAVGV
jgi:hypothetical protein